MASVTAAAYPIEMGTPPQTYWMSPLTERDFEELNNWVRSEVIKTAANSLTDEMPQRTRDDVMDAAVRQASRISWTDDKARMSNPSSVARVFWVLLKKRHPDLTPEQVLGMVMDELPKVLPQFKMAFQQLMMDGRPTPKEGSPKDQAHHRPRKKSTAS